VRTLGLGKLAHEGFASTLRFDVFDPGPRLAEADAEDAVPPRGRPEQPGRLTILDTSDAELPDGALARRAAELLAQNQQARFLLAVGFHRPHAPLAVPRRYFEMYPPERVELPRQPPELLKLVPRAAFALDPGFRDMDDARSRLARSAYYAAVSFLDAQVGVVLDALDRLGLSSSTAVVLTSDQGFLLGEHGAWGKHMLFEKAARVPLIVAAPLARQGAVSPRLVKLVDLYPTVSELLGAELPAGLEGESFLALLSEPERPWKRAAFTEDRRGKPARSLRSERYRYTEWPRGALELYDYETDPEESRNRALDPALAGVRAELEKLLDAGWRAAQPLR
jgi:uncharacterized sulfatase